MVVNYPGERFYSIGPWWQTINLQWYFNPRKCRQCAISPRYFYNIGDRFMLRNLKSIEECILDKQENSRLKLTQMSNKHWCWKNELDSNINLNFDPQMSLSKSKCWYLNNCLIFLKHAVPLMKLITFKMTLVPFCAPIA
jgi:hypothetical protein